MNDPQPIREKLAQLVSDYDWLENHCRRQPELAQHAGNLRLAAALARNVLGGALEHRPAVPLHIAVVGGAGSGKSTVTNFLAGSVVAEANPQAGYTRHPTAFVATEPANWPSYLGFLGPLRKTADEIPSNLDEDVYQVRRFSVASSDDPLADDVLWDCPDMTTWASANYVLRLLEVAALADVIVYVASDERYNDEVPTQFLQLLVRAGKAVVVVLTKMKADDAPALIEHFRMEVLARILDAGGIPPIPVVAIPNLPARERDDPAKAGAKYRVQLLNQILVLCQNAEDARRRTVHNAMTYLETSADGLLDVARKDLTELESWRSGVASGKRTFEERYINEYLVGEPFRRFDRTRQHLLELLEPPGQAQYLGRAMSVLRLPYTYARDFLLGLGQRAEMPNLPEQTVLTNALTGWFDQLQAECLRRADLHPIWKDAVRAFDSGLKQQANDRFQVLVRNFEQREGDELERAGRSLAESWNARPALLDSLRYGKIAVDLLAIAAVIWWTWIPKWYHLLLIPVAAAVSHTVAEIAIRLKVESVRSRARAQRESLLREQITTPLARWLDELPATDGSIVDRLRLALRRIPENLRAIKSALTPANPA